MWAALRALQLEPESPHTSYMAALALRQQNTRRETSIENLKAAAPKFSHACKLKALVH